MGGIWFVSYFAGYENPNLPGIKSFTALPFRARAKLNSCFAIAFALKGQNKIAQGNALGNSAKKAQP